MSSRCPKCGKYITYEKGSTSWALYKGYHIDCLPKEKRDELKRSFKKVLEALEREGEALLQAKVHNFTVKDDEVVL